MQHHYLLIEETINCSVWKLVLQGKLEVKNEVLIHKEILQSFCQRNHITLKNIFRWLII